MPIQATKDILSFLRAWSTSPGRVGAVLPSGASLAELITREITPASGPVLELGAGTGVFTRALLARGVPEEQLVLVEAGAEFAAMLQRRFPRATVARIDAAQLSRGEALALGSAGAAISGLPLLNMSLPVVSAIVGGAFACLRPHGAFYQFTYGPRCPVPLAVLEELGLQAKTMGRTWLNVPPAAVYKITRRR